MKIIHDPNEFQTLCRSLRAAGKSTALVPTMGFLHAGHLSLMDEADRLADVSIATIFVNPTQFGPNEDLDSYPRALEQDARLAEEHGIDFLFAPKPDAMYHPDHGTWIEVPELAKGLCGASRPTHFRGVCTVVAKLFLLVDPTYAIFGQKDWQQLAILRRMTRDLMFPVQIVGMPIVREEDGLALSSRNVNLSVDERQQAPNIQAGLQILQDKVKRGEKNADTLLDALAVYYKDMVPAAEIDYLELIHPNSLEKLSQIDDTTLIAVALKMSRARLIDNFLLEV